MQISRYGYDISLADYFYAIASNIDYIPYVDQDDIDSIEEKNGINDDSSSNDAGFSDEALLSESSGYLRRSVDLESETILLAKILWPENDNLTVMIAHAPANVTNIFDLEFNT